MKKKPSKLSTHALAQRLYRAARTENGHPREAWVLARRLAGYLRHPQVGPEEEIAFSHEDQARVGVARFRCNPRGKLRDYVMISLEAGDIPDSVWTQLVQLAQAKQVEMGRVWQAKGVG